MKLLVHLKLLCCLLLGSISSALYAVAADPAPRHIIFASDPKFPSSEKSDNKEVESIADTETRSRWLIDAQYSSIAEFRTQSGGSATIPIMINGNLTAFGQDSQRSYIRAVLQDKLDNAYDYGLGSHDYDFNVASCANCAAGSVEDLKARYWGKVPSMDLAARSSGFTKTWYGSLAFSRDFGDIHLIQLHNEPTYAVNFSTQSFINTTAYEITSSLDWLERDLQRAQAQGKIILLSLHQPFNWPVKEREIMRFKKMIEDYGVTAVFSASEHRKTGLYESTNYIYGDIPLFMSGSATLQSWLYASFSADRTELTVNVIASNDWRNPVTTHTIPVR